MTMVSGSEVVLNLCEMMYSLRDLKWGPEHELDHLEPGWHIKTCFHDLMHVIFLEWGTFWETGSLLARLGQEPWMNSLRR